MGLGRKDEISVRREDSQTNDPYLRKSILVYGLFCFQLEKNTSEEKIQHSAANPDNRNENTNSYNAGDNSPK